NPARNGSRSGSGAAGDYPLSEYVECCLWTASSRMFEARASDSAELDFPQNCRGVAASRRRVGGLSIPLYWRHGNSGAMPRRRPTRTLALVGEGLSWGRIAAGAAVPGAAF